MKKILASVASVTAVCLAAVPAFAGDHSHSAPASVSVAGGTHSTGSAAPAPMAPASSPAMGGSSPSGVGPGANGSNFGGTGNTGSVAPRVNGGTASSNPSAGSGGTARFSPGVLAQAQSLQQRLAAARAAVEQGGPESSIETIPVAGEPVVPPNTKVIRGRG